MKTPMYKKIAIQLVESLEEVSHGEILTMVGSIYDMMPEGHPYRVNVGMLEEHIGENEKGYSRLDLANNLEELIDLKFEEESKARMSHDDYQKWALTKDRGTYQDVGDRLSQQTGQLRLLHGAMGISGESGELMDAIKKHVMYNKPLDVDNVKEELGDLAWYMAIMLDQIGSSFGEVMELNHDKLEKRYPTGYTDQAAKDRADKK